MHYFGPWSDPDGALKKYLSQKDDLHAGRKPREAEVSTGVTVKVLCNRFLNHKERGRDAGDISPRTFENDKETAERCGCTRKRGLKPSQTRIETGSGASRLCNRTTQHD